ncbi:TPA: glycosyltransferase [Photobacterium damselae]
MKKVLIITDISLSRDYNAGNKNALISLCDFFNKSNEFSLDVINYHHKNPSKNLDFKVKHFPDYMNLISRKMYQILRVNKKLLNYKKSYFREKMLSIYLSYHSFDYIIIEYIENHHLLDICKKSNCIVLCDLHDVMSLRKKSFEENGRIPKNENLNIELKDEINVINRFDSVITIEDSERDFLKNKNVKANVILCKRILTVDKNYTPKDITNGKNIGFIGSSAEFNFDAISFFINNIWNMGLYLSNYNLIIAGSVCNVIDKLNIKGKYKILGKVECVSEFYSAIHVSINPIFSGSGFKTKNAESLSYGVPIITTSNGIKGLEDIDSSFYSLIEYSDSFEKWDLILNKIFESYYFSDVCTLCAKNFHQLNNENIIFKEINDYFI